MIENTTGHCMFRRRDARNHNRRATAEFLDTEKHIHRIRDDRDHLILAQAFVDRYQ